MSTPTTPYLDPTAIARVKDLEVRAKQIVEGYLTGLHRSPYHGFSVEFAEHRAYNPGEPLRNVDWKVYGKTERLYTKRYEEETNLRCHLVLDVSDSMRYPPDATWTKLTYGAHLAAAIGYLMVRQRDAVGLSLFDESLRVHLPSKARAAWLRQLFLRLDALLQGRELFRHRTAAAESLHQLANKIGRRGFVVLFTDLFSELDQQDALLAALQRLRHAHHEVLVFHLLEPHTELEFNFPNRPLTLRDLETGAELRVQPQQVRQAYIERAKAHFTSLERRCRELQVDFIPLDIHTPYAQALQRYLVKRQRLTKASGLR